MKKTLFLTLLCVLLLTFSAGVLADAAVYDWEVSEECNYDAYVSTVDGGVNLRVEPTTEAAILCTIPDFVCLHITMETSNGWGFTEYNGDYGWVALSQLSKSYPIKSVSINVKVTASDGVNLREGPYTSYDKLISSAIPQGEVLQVTGISQNNWGQVTYKGVTGWIAMSQVSEVKANTSVPADEEEDEDEDETEEEETVEPAETENATAELLDSGESQSSFPMVALFIGLIIIVVIVAAVLIVVIVTKKK